MQHRHVIIIHHTANKKTWYYTIVSHNLCVRQSMAEDNRKAGKTEVLCLSANKLFNSAGMRADITKGLVHSLTASTTTEVKRESGRICSVLGYFIPAPILLLVAVLCRIVPYLCSLQSWNWRHLAILIAGLLIMSLSDYYEHVIFIAGIRTKNKSQANGKTMGCYEWE